MVTAAPPKTERHRAPPAAGLFGAFKLKRAADRLAPPITADERADFVNDLRSGTHASPHHEEVVAEPRR